MGAHENGRSVPPRVCGHHSAGPVGASACVRLPGPPICAPWSLLMCIHGPCRPLRSAAHLPGGRGRLPAGPKPPRPLQVCSTIELREQWAVFRWRFEGPGPRSHGRPERHEHAWRVPRWWRMGTGMSSGLRGHLALRSGHSPAPRALWAANRPMAGRPGLDGGAEPDPEFGAGVPKAPLVSTRPSCESHLDHLCWARSLAWQVRMCGPQGGRERPGTQPRVWCPHFSRKPGPF